MTGPVIDFRVRPATDEWMDRYGRTPGAHRWAARGYAPPARGGLAEFAAQLRDHRVRAGVLAGRRSWLGRLPNAYVAECVRRCAGRLVGFAGIDPADRAEALAEFRTALDDLGLLGIALDPPDPVHDPFPRGYDDRDLMFPLYDEAQRRGVPVILTVGPMVGRADDPWAVDTVAAHFPELTIICSHGIWPRTLEWVAVAEQNPNVYLETSVYLGKPGCEPLYAAMAGPLRDKVLYGSAYPFHPLATARLVERLPLDAAAVRRLLHDNAHALLRRHGWEEQ